MSINHEAFIVKVTDEQIKENISEIFQELMWMVHMDNSNKVGPIKNGTRRFIDEDELKQCTMYYKVWNFYHVFPKYKDGTEIPPIMLRDFSHGLTGLCKNITENFNRLLISQVINNPNIDIEETVTLKHTPQSKAHINTIFPDF